MQLHTNNSEDLTSREIFQINVEFMQGKYPHRNISLVKSAYGDLVQIDGEIKFNTEGYCLLYNLKRMCDALEDELI
ncbi:MAG: hypothetical protein II453_12220 [Alphaproteobacteria bacterium]|nr:hypothetical protein [Alphaproteobacteria bacterium]